MNQLTTLYSGMILDRPNKEGPEARESIRFLDIIWAKPHITNGVYGTMVLHARGDFRFYSNPFGAISTQVCAFVGRLVKQGVTNINNAPTFPWVTDQSKP